LLTFIHSWFFVADQGDTVYHFCDPGMYDIHFAIIVDIVLVVLQLFAVLTFVGLWHRSKRLTCTLDNEHLRVLGTRYQLNENTNTTKLMIPIVTISAVLVLSYSVTYAIFFPSLGQNASITKELLNSINQYAPVAEFLILLMPVITIAFMFSMLALSTPIRRSFFRLTGLRRCFHDSTNRIDSAQHAATAIHFEMLEKQWNEIYKREHCRLPRRSQHYVTSLT
uniref:G_PROTEIN_RECEP_F1_2 domain-containing protein n=1 Tax=Toxocara canis TaxID=6265 RepID=A0A183UZ82_TOXCA